MNKNPEAASFSESWLNLFPEMRTFLDDGTDLGELIARFLGLNIVEYTDHSGRSVHPDMKVKTLGWMCRKTMAKENPSTSNERFYTDKEIDYFWSKVDTVIDRIPIKFHDTIKNRRPSPELAGAICRLAEQAPVLTLTGRLRAGASYTARHNTIFQGLAADGAKLALWKLFRAGYRVVNFIHDEFLVEVPEDDDLSFHAEAIQRLMIEGMQEVVPDVRVGVEFSASRFWSKNAVAVYDENGLIPWVRIQV